MSSCASTRSATGCPSLPVFDGSDWASVEMAFEGAPRWPLVQGWRAEPEAGFREATVATGWRGDRLLFFGELEDGDVFTKATARNQKLWMLGDVFEFFGGEKGNPAYIEYHTAPNGKILQLRFADSEALGKVPLEDLMVKDNEAVLRAARRPGGWMVYGEVPGKALTGKSGSLSGRTWEVSFSRYDYTRGSEKPVISSTSPHQKASFHRRHEWRKLRFVKAKEEPGC